MENYSQYSSSELIWTLGGRFKEYRLRLKKTQEEIAARAGVSVSTVHRFENGNCRDLSLSVFLLLIKSLGLIDNIEQLLPELPVSSYQYTDSYKRIQRVRHKR